MVRIAVLGSGTGTNFDAIWRAVIDGKLDAEIVCVVSDREQAPILEKARKLGLTSKFLSLSKSGPGFDAYIEYLHTQKVQYVVLAGFMRILPASFIAAFKSSRGNYSNIVNVHPSLLPEFRGLNAYEKTFQSGSKIAGVTIHLVDEKLDHGPICAQRSFSIEGCKSSEEVRDLGLRIEHELYPETLGWVIKDQFVIEGSKCVRTR